jgi:hypothetical protein
VYAKAFGRDPQRGVPERPGPQRGGEAESHSQQGEEGALDDGEQHPRIRSDDEHPAGENQEEGDAEAHSQQRGSAPRDPSDEQAQPAHRYDRQRPQVVRREGERQAGSREDRRDETPRKSRQRGVGHHVKV